MFLLIFFYSLLVMEMNMAVGQSIREERKSRHISQEMLADAIDSHQVYISEIEKGKKIPSITILRDIARCFNMSLTEFVAIIEEKLNNQRIADTK